MPKGTMTETRQAKGVTPLSGYENYGTITITYSFPSGVQGNLFLLVLIFRLLSFSFCSPFPTGPEHRNPGAPYTGTSRTCYLPDTPEGNEILKLLKIAFDRRLTFTVGLSVTNGTDNTVVWNGYGGEKGFFLQYSLRKNNFLLTLTTEFTTKHRRQEDLVPTVSLTKHTSVECEQS